MDFAMTSQVAYSATTLPNHSHQASLLPLFLNFQFSIFNLRTMIKVNWNTVAKVLKFVATVITSVLGTIAVQSCTPHWPIF